MLKCIKNNEIFKKNEYYNIIDQDNNYIYVEDHDFSFTYEEMSEYFEFVEESTVSIPSFLKEKEYDFIKENDKLKDNIILLTYGGSYAYGLDTENSDIDIRGCALNSVSDLLGMSNFEQFIDNKTDTTIYSFNKLIKLLYECNPNVIEILGNKPEHYFVLSPEGKELIKNRKIFLSQKAISSFGGYAIQQLRRLENALARDGLPQPKKEEHILNAVKRANAGYENRHLLFDRGTINMYIDEGETEGFEKEIFADINFVHYPIRQFRSMLNEIGNVLNDYDSLGKRNHKKDEAHLNKHAMHLIRLYLMCIDILEKEEIITYRENDRDMLLEIRNGKYMREDGTYDAAFFDMVNEYEKRLNYARKNTSLPKNPDIKKIEEFMIDINMRIIK